jgi:hypothetical protein
MSGKRLARPPTETLCLSCGQYQPLALNESYRWRECGCDPGERRLVYCTCCHKTHAVETSDEPCAPGAWLDPSPLPIEEGAA